MQHPGVTSLRAVYVAEIGVREATDRNDGPRIAEYLAYCGLGEGYEWCAAFVSWCHGQAGYAAPRNAWAAALFPTGRTLWRVGERWPVAGNSRAMGRKGDVFGIYVASKKRIGHVGFVDEWRNGYIITVEGNVDHGVVRKRRPLLTLHAIANWTGSQ